MQYIKLEQITHKISWNSKTKFRKNSICNSRGAMRLTAFLVIPTSSKQAVCGAAVNYPTISARCDLKYAKIIIFWLQIR